MPVEHGAGAGSARGGGGHRYESEREHRGHCCLTTAMSVALRPQGSVPPGARLLAVVQVIGQSGENEFSHESKPPAVPQLLLTELMLERDGHEKLEMPVPRAPASPSPPAPLNQRLC